jgi:secreted trypsin-like serine protease
MTMVLARVLVSLLWVTALLPTSASAARRHHQGRLGAKVQRQAKRHHGSRHIWAHAAIIGGTPARVGTFPWLAHVADIEGDVFRVCTGTVVAPRLILTAAHCAENIETGVLSEASGYKVVTRNLDWAAPPTDKQISTVSRVTVYPFYEPIGLLEGWGDAALLELSSPITAPPIPLASSAQAQLWQPGTRAQIAGWGDTYPGQATFSEVLHWAPTVIQGSEWCHSQFGGFLPLGQLCTIDPPNYQTGGCGGDSGGPLLVTSSGGTVEVGILVLGTETCSTAAATVYTRAELVASWVDRWIKALARRRSTASSHRERPQRSPLSLHR